MLSVTLNTNEVKDRAGTEVEFQRINQSGRTVEYAQITETPIFQHRLKVSHQETGVGTNKRRRSVTRIDKTVAGADSLPVTIGGYLVLDIPIGNLTTYDEPKNVLAEVLSFNASTGANSTILFDCTGNGAAALISGGL